MWLDGLYMAAPFLAQYGKVFNEPAAFDDVITQFVLMEKHARDEKSGLLTHGWDESREQKWADPKTGRSPAFWGRAMGWCAMGLVETLDFIPPDHPLRGELIAIFSAWRRPSRASRIRRAASGGRSSISPGVRRTAQGTRAPAARRRCSQNRQRAAGATLQGELTADKSAG